MLPKKLRLKRNEVAHILTYGSTHKSRFFIVRIFKNDEKESRFATVISKKFAKKAVERSKAKRQIQEAIRKNLNHFEETEGVSTILIPKKICLQTSYQELEKDIIFILQNIKKWENI